MRMSLTGSRFEKTAGVEQVIRQGLDRIRVLPGVVAASAMQLLNPNLSVSLEQLQYAFAQGFPSRCRFRDLYSRMIFFQQGREVLRPRYFENVKDQTDRESVDGHLAPVEIGRASCRERV